MIPTTGVLKSLRRDVDGVPIPEALGALEVLRAELWAELATPAPKAPPAPTPPATTMNGALLTVRQAADRMHVSVTWLYRNHHHLPFVRRIGRSLRFDPHGLDRWLDHQC